MLKKLLTGCLTIVAAAALAVPAMAAEMSGKVNGRAIGEFMSSSDKYGKADAVSKLDMQGRARFGYDLIAKEGEWTVTGKFETLSEYGIKYGDTGATLLQKFVKLENDAFSVSLGTQWWGICYKTATGAWTTGEAIDRPCYGIGASMYGAVGNAAKVDATLSAGLPQNLKSRDDRMIIGIKSVGLQVMLEMNYMDVGSTTGDQYNTSAYGVQYDGAFGPVSLTAAYVTKGLKANDKASEKTSLDGAAFTELTLGVQYNVSEAMAVEFEYEAEGYTLGTSGSKTATTTAMGLAFSMALSESQGLLVGYDTSVTNSGVSGAKDYNYASLTFDFIQKIAGQKFYAGYKSDAMTSDNFKGTQDGGLQSSKILVGAKVTF